MSGGCERQDAAEALVAGLRARGYDVLESADFGAFQRARAGVRRHAPSPPFDPARGGIDGLWFRLSDPQGRVLGLQAVRLVEPIEASLWEDLTRHRDRYAPPGPGVDPWRSAVTSHAARGMTGRVVAYHGEGWLSETLRKCGLARPFICLGLLAAWRDSDPDLLFGILVPATNSGGFAQVVGYRHYEDEAFDWTDGEGNSLCREGLCWSWRSDLEELAREVVTEAVAVPGTGGVVEKGDPSRIHYPPAAE